jgi:hypothetical protein
MGTQTGQQIVDRAWIKAQDTNGGSGIRWPSTECLLWLNDGQREIVNQLPKAYPLRATPTTVSGTRQTLAGLSLTDGIAVIDVVRNFGADGTTAGRAITKRDRLWFDEQRPAWHSETAAEAYHWMFDERDPKAFYLYPGKTSGKVELIYSANPTDLASLSSAITLDDIYANALQWFVLFSFYSKDAVYTKSPQLAAQYWGLFMQALGFRDKAVVMASAQGDARAAGQS